ncbi:Uncharacterised protein [Mycobacterium tuberculosis]|nr:Uncharacterised protein [Mycobacterium tuberculosis]
MEQAAYMFALMLKVEATPDNAAEVLQSRGFLKPETADAIANKQELTNGDTYLMIRDVFNAVKDLK